MNLNALLSLIAAALAGSTMGSFLLLTVIYRPVFTHFLDLQQRLVIYRRFYRLNTVLCLLGAIAAALVKYPQASLLMGILATSYVFASMYLIKGFVNNMDSAEPQSQRMLVFLTLVQNLLHAGQFIAAAWVVYYLN